ncbi:DUF2878 domain-containing protein [Vibrio mytili]|uniref:DUF2878 domain-containing protein n=1 Tax=Vibrio mytili TaxID=50718 RepID=UPI002F41E601
MLKIIVASTWFQLFWFCAVLGKENWQWLTTIFVALTFSYCLTSERYALKYILAVTLAGIVLDTLNQYFNLLVFHSEWLPIWLAYLWFVFAWYAYQLKSILIRYPLRYVSVIGGLAGAGSYFAGYKLGAVELGYGYLESLGFLFIEWVMVIILVRKVYENGIPDKSVTTHSD